MKSADRGGGVKKAPSRRSGGFTLIELMVTVAIAAIVLALAAPAFTDLIARNRMTAAVNTFVTNLQLARSEAVKRGSAVSLCPDNPDTDEIDCSGDTDWDVGYLVFFDPDENGELANPEADVVRHVEGSTTAAITVTGKDEEDDFVAFLPDGSRKVLPTDADRISTFQFRDPNLSAPGTNVLIAETGHSRCEFQCADGTWKSCGTFCN